MLFSTLEQTHCARMWFYMSEQLFIVFFFYIHRSGVQRWHGWCHKKLLPSRHVLCTPYNHAPCHFMQSHIHKVYACLAVACHLHFWQNDRDLLRATAVTQGWNGYRNKGQHRKLTLEKKILPPLQQGFEPATFLSRVWRSNHWAIPAPRSRSLTTHFPRWNKQHVLNAEVSHYTLPQLKQTACIRCWGLSPHTSPAEINSMYYMLTSLTMHISTAETNSLYSVLMPLTTHFPS